MLRDKKFYIALSMAVFLSVNSGCSRVGPDFSSPLRVELPKKPISGKGTKDPSIEKWWHIYSDRDLNRLVKALYRQSPDLEAAGTRIVQARAMLGISIGMSLPQKQTVSGSAMVSDDNSASASHSVVTSSFEAGWELDLWGKYARGIESSKAGLYAAIASYNDILVSLIAEMAKNYIQYRTTQERIVYARRNIAIQEYVTRVTEIQFRSGNVSELDMQQARTQLHSTRAALYELELSLARYESAMSTLLGIPSGRLGEYIDRKDVRDDLVRRLDTKGESTFQIDEKSGSAIGISLVPMPRFDPSIPIDAELITRRPDIRAAEYLAHAQSARIGMSEAELYPSFSLLGSISYGKDSRYPHTVSIVAGPSFAWNIFQYGRIKNDIRLQDALFEERLCDYNKKVISALNEVTYSLKNYKITLRQFEENKKAVEASVRAFNISMRQYSEGLVSYQRLLNSVEKLTRYQDQHARIKGSLSVAVVSIYRSLGGGWQISRGGRYLSRESVERMKSRSDWGDMLEESSIVIPKGWKG
jgi:outer membrane protein TolC